MNQNGTTLSLKLQITLKEKIMKTPINPELLSLAIALFALILFTSCVTDAGELESIEGEFRQNHTFELVVQNGLLYAATDSGLFRKNIHTEDENWESLGLGNTPIRTFVVFSDQEIMASVDFGNDNPKSTIAKTTDGGQSWTDFRNGYSDGINQRVPRGMVMDHSNPDILFAGGPGGLDIAKSMNRGQSWELVLGSWQNLGFFHFIKVDRNNSDIVWAGGSNAVFQPILDISVDGGENWEKLQENLQIYENTVFEGTTYDIAIDSRQSSRVLLGLSGGIFRSEDAGQTWESVFSGAGIYSLTHSASNSEIIYASGQNMEGSLFFLRSTDFGDTWQTIVVPDVPDKIRVNDMVSLDVDGREVLYFGTDKGVYSYTVKE